jgi:membrane protein DedA with SNARE-associated domain
LDKISLLSVDDLVTTIFHWVEQYGYPGLFSSLMLGIVGIPLPDEVLLTFAGYLVFKGHLTLSLTIATAFLGSACGISLSYFLGRTVGLYLLVRYARNLVSDQKMNQVHKWFERFGKWGLLLGYFVPGIRHLTALVAGASKLELPVFALFAYSGGA